MIFPAQTSLIPATVALVRWIETNGFSGLYPYWYLGTTPVKYLIGPVVPGVLVGLHKFLPGSSLFDLSYLILTTLYLILLRLLHPFMPFITEELCRKLGAKDSIMVSSWPAK